MVSGHSRYDGVCFQHCLVGTGETRTPAESSHRSHGGVVGGRVYHSYRNVYPDLVALMLGWITDASLSGLHWYLEEVQ